VLSVYRVVISAVAPYLVTKYLDSVNCKAASVVATSCLSFRSFALNLVINKTVVVWNPKFCLRLLC
jgi:hypothetical protein